MQMTKILHVADTKGIYLRKYPLDFSALATVNYVDTQYT